MGYIEVGKRSQLVIHIDTISKDVPRSILQGIFMALRVDEISWAASSLTVYVEIVSDIPPSFSIR